MENRGQSAIEFMIIIGAMLFFFLSFMYVLGLQKADDIKEKRNLEVRDVALSVKDEISLAGEASDGYRRSFTIPQKISGFLDYTIKIEGNLLYVATDDKMHAMAYPVFNVTGQPFRGWNNITKRNGRVYLN